MNNNAFHHIRQPFDQIPQKNPRSQLGDREFVTALSTAVTSDAGSGSLESLRRSVIALTDVNISKASFHQRLATRKLHRLLDRGLRNTPICHTKNKAERKILKALGVDGILLQDSTVLALPKKARFIFPGVNADKNAAAIKIHMTFNLIAQAVADYEISSGAEHDSQFFPEYSELKNKLIIADLGYYDFSRFDNIDKQGGSFLSRIKTNTVAIITDVFSDESKTNINKPLNESRWEGDVVDIECRFGQAVESPVHRVVGYWNTEEEKYHFYMTNLKVDAKIIYPLYRIRWQVELAFKALKQSLTPDRLSSSVPMIIKNLICIYLLRFRISTNLSLCVRLDEAEKNTRSIQMGAKIFNHIITEVFKFLVHGSKRTLNAFKKKLALFHGFFTPQKNKKKFSAMQNLYEQLNGS